MAADQDSFSWRSVRDQNGDTVLRPVIKQYKNTCWAIAGREAISTQHKIRHMEEIHLVPSMEEVLTCVKRWYGALDQHMTLKEKYESFRTTNVFEYARARGLTLALDYPFERLNVRCSPPIQATRLFVTGDYTIFEGPLDEVQEGEVNNRIVNFPVVGLVDLYYPSFETVGEGVYTGPSQGDLYKGVHAILITGFGVDDTSGIKYYEFKNSRGPKFGVDGFGKIQRDLLLQISYPNHVEKVEGTEKNGIQHKYIKVEGVQLHVSEIGDGSKIVVFCYGFPELWYSWRHQMLALAKAGFRVIVPDYRGYGISETPQQHHAKTTFDRFVADLAAILDYMNIAKVFLVAKGFGVRVASIFTLRYQEKVSGLLTFGLPFIPDTPASLFGRLPTGYLTRWVKPEVAEEDFKLLDAKTIVRKFYTLFSRSEIPEPLQDENILNLVENDSTLPPWLTEGDLEVYGIWYRKSGFKTAWQVPYRSFDENPGIVNPYISIPTLMIVAEQDYSLKIAGLHDYIRKGSVREFIPNLEIVNIPEGGHFVQEQYPEQVNEAIIQFISKHVG